MDETEVGFGFPAERPWESLSVVAASPGVVDLHCRAAPRITADGSDGERAAVRVFRVDVVAGVVTMFPMKNLQVPTKRIEPKYRQIRRISFSGAAAGEDGASVEGQAGEGRLDIARLGGAAPGLPVEAVEASDAQDTVPKSVGEVMAWLEELPSYCVKQPRYGLGFRQPFRAVVGAIESLTEAREIRIADCGPTRYVEEGGIFEVSAADMVELVKAINRVDGTTRTAANTVNETTTYNAVADILGVPRRAMKYGRSALRKVLTAVGNDERPLSDGEQDELVGTLTRNASSILKREPGVIEGLASGIEMARVRDILDNLRRMMAEGLPERTWQEFLAANPFILSMVFGRPIVKVGDQASVGTRTIKGSGGRIADFLVRNSLTNNAALVEIKTPAAKLLQARAYRNSVYVPSGELVGAINQVLDQKSRFEQEIAAIRNQNRSLELEAHHVHACVLAGTMPVGEDRVRSFELFRHNLKDVVVVTFDELVAKVDDVRVFLAGGGDAEVDVRDGSKEAEEPR